jgi:PTH1 family peptidyl-tRNA hydrolase
MKKKIYIFALGNIGDVYKNTRHNAARIALSNFDFFNNVLNIKYNSHDNLLLNDIFEIVYIEPDCYMNQSGVYIKQYLKNKNIDYNHIIIIYDDIDITIGKIKNSFSRSGGGHNGVKNIIEVLNTKDFFSIRIGIRPNFDNLDNKNIYPDNVSKIYNIKDFVLKDFNSEDIKVLKSPYFASLFSHNLIQILKQIKSQMSS